jgi:hypothetical protein
MNVVSPARVFTPCCEFFRVQPAPLIADNPAVPTVRGRFAQ